MGRIRTTQKNTCIVVTLEGRLTAADMGRLERACAQELISSTPRLEIDVRRVTYTDDTATAVLRRLVQRGAVLTRSAAAASVAGCIAPPPPESPSPAGDNDDTAA
jgi:hypothetical protein